LSTQAQPALQTEDLSPEDLIAKFKPPTPPRPSYLSAPVLIRHLVSDYYGFFQSFAANYGDVAQLPLPGVTLTVISHPDLIHSVMVRNWSRYSHSDPDFDGALSLGDPPAMPTTDGEEWRRARRVLNPMFTDRAISTVTSQIAGAVDHQLDNWDRWADTKSTIDIQHELAVLVMGGLMGGLFANKVDQTWIQEFAEESLIFGGWTPKALMTRLLTRGLPQKVGDIARHPRFPWPHLAAGKRNYYAIRDRMDGLIESRKSNPDIKGDLLDVLLNARFEDGSGFSVEEIRSNLAAILFAGHETTAAALAWTIALLTLHPHQLARAEAEVDALSGQPLDHEITKKIPFLQACFDEALRFQGTPALPAFAVSHDVVGGFHIRPGDWVIMPMHAVHTDPRFWDEPLCFKPERFLDGAVNKRAFFPFGGGPRKCLGFRMAYIEGAITLVALMRRYRFRLPPGWQPVRKFHMATGMQTMPVQIEKRR
jgi:cytochrome P450